MERDADAVAAARRLALIRAATLEAAHLCGRCNEAFVGEESRITSQAVRHTPLASQTKPHRCDRCAGAVVAFVRPVACAPLGPARPAQRWKGGVGTKGSQRSSLLPAYPTLKVSCCLTVGGCGGRVAEIDLRTRCALRAVAGPEQRAFCGRIRFRQAGRTVQGAAKKGQHDAFRVLYDGPHQSTAEGRFAQNAAASRTRIGSQGRDQEHGPQIKDRGAACPEIAVSGPEMRVG